MVYELGVVAYLKNEHHIIDEWIQHYLRVGVTKFYMFDNGSSDHTIALLQKYGDCVTIVDASEMTQRRASGSGFKMARKECDWVFVCDLDEFLFSKSNTLLDFLRQVPLCKDVVYVKWKNFILSSFYQPRSVIEDCVEYFPPVGGPRGLPRLSGRGKSLTRSRVSVETFRSGCKCHHCPGVMRERILACPPELDLNHYRWQSYEYLFGIKEGRGGGCQKGRYSNIQRLRMYQDIVPNSQIRRCHQLRGQSVDLIKKLHDCPPLRPMVSLYNSLNWQKLVKLGPLKFKTFKQGRRARRIIFRYLNTGNLGEGKRFIGRLRTTSLESAHRKNSRDR